MTHRHARGALIALSCMLTLGACSLAPRGKTVILRTPPAHPTAAVTAAPGAIGYKNASSIDLSQLDQAGLIDSTNIICGWLDNEHLAALGTVPVLAPGMPHPTQSVQALEKQKLFDAARISIKGITGQILSVNWKSKEIEPLQAVQSTLYTGLGLSHNKKKLWYTTMDDSGARKLAVTDISFKNTTLNTSDYFGMNPKWSSLDNYLYYMQYVNEKKAAQEITLFDGVQTKSFPYSEMDFGSTNLFNVDDKTNTAYSIIKNALIVSAPLDPRADNQTTDSPMDYYEFTKGQTLPVELNKAVWLGTDYVLMKGYTAQTYSKSSFGILDIHSGEPPHWYDGVINFAVSDDGKYLCFVKETETAKGIMPDISIAEWKNGQYTNETVIYKGFSAMESIFFSPDDTKVFLMGWSDSNPRAQMPSAIVVQFR